MSNLLRRTYSTGPLCPVARRQFLFAGLAGVSSLKLFSQTPSKDPWPSSALIEPAEFARQMASQTAGFSLFYVGFPVLYRGAHIIGAQLAGPCSKPEGLALLRKLAGSLPHETEIILYCGCCPWDQCPNIRPAYSALHALGFEHLKVIHIPKNLHTDWVVKGYPTTRV